MGISNVPLEFQLESGGRVFVEVDDPTGEKLAWDLPGWRKR
jgi:hypothetical protein